MSKPAPKISSLDVLQRRAAIGEYRRGRPRRGVRAPTCVITCRIAEPVLERMRSIVAKEHTTIGALLTHLATEYTLSKRA